MAELMGRMMQQPLLISTLIQHAARYAPEVEVVSRQLDHSLHRTCWAEIEKRPAAGRKF